MILHITLKIEKKIFSIENSKDASRKNVEYEDNDFVQNEKY